MTQTELTQKALAIATAAHDGQLDKAGQPYINHPKFLAGQMTDEYSTAVALLHDVVEDTAVTLEDLSAEGIPAQVIEAVRLLTHDKDVDYLAYVAAIKGNKIATQVKIADLRHNSDITRLPAVIDQDLQRLKKYQKALKILQA